MGFTYTQARGQARGRVGGSHKCALVPDAGVHARGQRGGFAYTHARARDVRRTWFRRPRGVGLTGLRTTRMGALVPFCIAKDLEMPTPKLRVAMGGGGRGGWRRGDDYGGRSTHMQNAAV